MFESSTAAKITFGGKQICKSSTDPGGGARPKRIPRPADGEYTDRKWVLDAINKYFDVIKEDEEEEEENESSSEYEDAVSEAAPENSDEDSDDSSSSESSEAGERSPENHPQASTSSMPAAAAASSSSSVVMRSSSSAHLRTMVKSIMTSRSDLNLNMFKANLSAHLQKSRESLGSCGGTPVAARKGTNREPGVEDTDTESEDDESDEDDELRQTTLENEKYIQVPL